jgi:hypothetical protein
MERSEFVVVYLPFETSDMTLEALAHGATEEDATKDFRTRHPNESIKSVTKR